MEFAKITMFEYLKNFIIFLKKNKKNTQGYFENFDRIWREILMDGWNWKKKNFKRSIP
jgi:hypothetical protein